jgi:hypothetical protein
MTTATVTTANKKRVRRRLLIGLGALVVLLIGYSVYSIARPIVLRSEIEIAATPDQVWKVLADRAAYPQWNPFIVSSTGDLTVGSTIRNVLRDTSGKETAFTPELLAVEPGKELRWIGKVGLGGIFDGEHSFRIEPSSPGHVRLIQEEKFRGIAVPVMTGWLNAEIKPQFDAMNQALAARVGG